MEMREFDIQKLVLSYSSHQCCSLNMSGFHVVITWKNIIFCTLVLDDKL